MRGPITAKLQNRVLITYLAMAALGVLIASLGSSHYFQVAGIGLLFPGAGFIAAGGWSFLLLPLGLSYFW